LLLTAFYVDNGKNLPLWNQLPPIAFWLLPGAVGTPFIVRALLRHPLVQRSKGSAWRPADKGSGRRAETRG
jgi:hypothetical protein